MPLRRGEWLLLFLFAYWLTRLQEKKRNLIYFFLNLALSLSLSVLFSFFFFVLFLVSLTYHHACFHAFVLVHYFHHFYIFSFSTLREVSRENFSLKKRKAERYLKYYVSQTLHITQDLKIIQYGCTYSMYILSWLLLLLFLVVHEKKEELLKSLKAWDFFSSKFYWWWTDMQFFVFFFIVSCSSSLFSFKYRRKI